jgi:DNA-directed RNA polymerase specialized sigma24 family protein
MEEVRDVRTDVEVVYRAQHERLWRALFSYTGDPHIAADAEGEAFAQLLRRGAAVSDPAAWVWRAAFKIAGGLLQSRRRLMTSTDYPLDLFRGPVRRST